MTAPPRLDRIDVEILAQLQQNGKLTNVELADQVGLSASPCLARIKRLEKAGYIEGYNARLNLSKFGDSITVFTQVMNPGNVVL
jgi:DNA-binding Lrp family transcriptional regulator